MPCFYIESDYCICQSNTTLTDTEQYCFITVTFWFYGKERCAGALDVEMEGRDQLNGKQRHQLKHRELFLSRQVETLPATHIRGKCSVTLLNETESFLSYLNKDVSTSIIFCRLRPPVVEPR